MPKQWRHTRIGAFRRLAFIGVAVNVAALSVGTAPAVIPPCDHIPQKPLDNAANVSVARGVYSSIKVPRSDEVFNYDAQKFTIGDIALVPSTSREDFVQIGWYVGAGSPDGDIPYVSTPHIFYGEDDPQVIGGGEILRLGPALNWNTFHTLSIWRHDPGTGSDDDFYFFVDGVFRTSTVQLHNRYNKARFLGEVNYVCTGMAAWAYKPQTISDPSFSTLQYLVDKPGGTVQWYLFADLYYPTVYYNIISVGDRATAYAYGPGH